MFLFNIVIHIFAYLKFKMKKMKKFKIILVLLFATNQIYSQQPDHSKLVVGYYAQWSIYTRDYNVLDIEGDKLTHIMYAFFDATYDSSTLFD